MAEKKGTDYSPQSRIRLLFPENCREPEDFKTMVEVNEKYPDRNFEVGGIFEYQTPDNVMETVVQMKWRLHKLVLIAHGSPVSPNPKCPVSEANPDKRCELPKNVTLVFYCNIGETWAAEVGLRKYISAVCAGAKASSEIVHAGQKYDDLILTYADSEFGRARLENPNQVKPCDPTLWSPIDFPNNSRLSDLIGTLDPGFLWELHVMACRADSEKATSTRTSVTYDVRGRPVMSKKKIQYGGQCQGLTYKGQPCKRHGDPYCYQHNAP